MTFGAYLRQRRLCNGLRQSDLADKVGCDHSYVSLVESNGRRPSLSMAISMAMAIGESPIQYIVHLANDELETAGCSARMVGATR